MENTSCIICHKNNTVVVGTKAIVHKQGQEVQATNVLCRTCGLVFMNPRPDEAEYQDIYKRYSEERHSHTTTEAIIQYINSVENKTKGESVAEFLRPYIHSGMKALDIGAGVGVLAAALRDRLKIDITAIEPGVLLAKTASDYYKLPFFNGNFDQYVETNKNGKFDLLVLHHVFEHFSDPIKELYKLKQSLASNGILYIEVPNILDFKKPVNQFFDLLHPFSYSLETLHQVLKMGGFKIIAWNKSKRWRIQIIAVPVNDSRSALADGETNNRFIAVRTRVFLFKRRMIDIVKKLCPPKFWQKLVLSTDVCKIKNK